MSREEALPRLGAGAPPRRRLLARGRSLTPVVLFWTSTLAVNASTVAVVAFLSHHQVSGGLPEASAVLALSLVIAVAPGALQLRAAADVAEAQPTPRPPWRLFGPLSVGLLLLAPLVAWAVSIPVIAAVLVALQLPPAVALSVCRGELIGSRRFGAAGLNLSVDAIVRLVAGVGLGLLWGATGIAAALALATLVALVVVWHRHELGAPALGGAVVVSGVALASVGLLANIDLLLAPRVLGQGGADNFDVAALPAQGIFLALFAASWLAVPGARARARTVREALGPVASTLLLGAAGTIVLILLRPIVGEILGRADPPVEILLPLAVAKAMTGATAVAVNVAVARCVRRPWAAPLLAVIALAAVAAAVRPDAHQLALLVLGAQALALALATARMLASTAAPPKDVADSLGGMGGLPTPESNWLPARDAAGNAIANGGVTTPERNPPPDLEAPPFEFETLPELWEPLEPERPPDREEPTAPAPPPPTRAPLPYVALTIASIGLMATCFAQAPGLLLADTKLDLVINPGGFLDRAMHLWDASASFGQVQNQAVGYLFPMGPFFAGGKALGVPMWIVQRLWIGLLLIVALWGAAELARQLGIGRPAGWLVAGLAYALSPLFISEIAATSAAVVPGALAPWALLPLVHGSRGGSPRRAAALSGLAVGGMGGVNAAATLAVLPLPALWLLTRRRSRRRRVLAGWWVLAVGLATAWWLLPLFFQQQWGFDFLPFTETASTTELATSAFEGLRGAGNWLAYLSLSGPWLPSGWSLVSSTVAVLATAVVAAIGFAGLARARVSERGFLIASVLVGMVLVCAGYLGPSGGALDGPIRAALDGPLAAFRNVDKFQPVLRLPLALGLAAVLAAVPRRRMWGTLATGGALGVVLVGALPMLQRDLPQQGSFEGVPVSWRQAARFLDRHSDGARALLVPAAPFGEYIWGRPLDDPIQPLARSPWAVRSLIPIGGAGSTSLLDAVERRLQSGVPSPGLQRTLARAGIRYVVARNDLDWRRAAAPRPAEVHAALVASGLRRVASFGLPLPEPQARGTLLPELGIGRYESSLPEIEIFAVRPSASLVSALPAARAVAVSGGPQSLPELTDRGLVGDRDPTFTVADLPRPDTAGRWVVTDALRRTDTDFGLVHDKDSYTLAPGEWAAGSLGPPRQLLSSRVIAGHEAVSNLSGQISRVTASSYGSWFLELPFVEPADAFDGDSTTAWVTGSNATSVGQWVRADLKQVISPARIRVRLLEDGPWRPLVTRLRVATASGSIASAVRPTESMQTIAVPRGPTNWVRITFARVRHELAGGATAGLRDVQLFATPLAPGDDPVQIPPASQWVRVPEEGSQLARAARPGATLPAFVFSRLSANPQDVMRRDQETQLRRIFVTAKQTRMQIAGTALPTPGPLLDSLLTDTRGMSVSATSSWDRLPGYRAGNLVDGSRRTAWIAAPPRPQPTGAPGATGLRAFSGRARHTAISPAPALTDPDPTIRLRWDGIRSLSRLRIAPAGDDFAASPRQIRLASPDGQRDLSVPRNGSVMRFAPLRTDRVAVSFPRVARQYTTTGIALDPLLRLPVGLAELEFPALRDLRVATLGPDSVVQEPCGEGPSILLDGQRLPTAVTATARDVILLRSLPVRICSGNSVELAAGRHRAAGEPGSAFTLSSLTLRPPSWASSAPQQRPRTVRIRHWGDDRRSIALGPGPSAYLAIRENFSDGWEATLRGKRLPAVRLDGWQQGFVLPAGRGGLVQLSFAPQDSYGLALRAGGGLALALLALVLIPSRRRQDEGDPGGPGRRPSTIVLVALGTAAIALVSVPVAIAVPALALLAPRKPGAVPWVAGGLVLAAGLVVAAGMNPHPLEHAGAFGVPAQLLTAVALALLTVSLWIRPPESRSDDD